MTAAERATEARPAISDVEDLYCLIREDSTETGA
jgi:hypothetical protein